MKKNDTTTLFDRVFVPEYSPQQQELLRRYDPYKANEELKEELTEKIKQVQNLLGSEEQPQKEGFHEPRPLTPEEGREVLKRRKEMLNDIKRIRDKLAKAQDKLDSVVDNGFTYRFKRKPQLKKAMRVVLQKKESNITYEDYKNALRIKKEMEQQEVKDIQEYPGSE